MKKYSFKYIAGMVIVVIFLYFKNTLIVSAYNLPNQETLANNELNFLSAINSKYPTSLNIYESDHPVMLHTPPDVTDHNNLNVYYRTLCSRMIIYSLDKLGHNQPQNVNDPLFQTFIKYAPTDFVYLGQDGSFTAPAPLYDCLIALNLSQDIFEPAHHQAVTTVLTQITTFLNNGYQPWNGQDYSKFHYTVDFFQHLQASNQGDTKAEEVGIGFSIYAAAAKLIPVSITGSQTINNNWLKRAQELADYSITSCTTNCPFNPNHLVPWLVANHQIDPNPTYTQSLFTSFGELAALYNQLEPGTTFPNNFYTETNSPTSITTLKTATNKIASALASYSTKNASGNLTFHYTGPYNKLAASSSVVITGSYNYDGMRYTLSPDLAPLINSTIPRTGIDSYDLFFMPDTADAKFYQAKKYVVQGNSMWHYICNYAKPFDPTHPDPTSCEAVYDNQLSIQWSGPNFTAWPTPAPTSNIDSFTQIMLPNQTTLYSDIFKGNQNWRYICTFQDNISQGCRADSLKTLADIWSTIGSQVAAGWAYDPAHPANLYYPPPTNHIDAISEWFLPDNVTLNVYVYAGDREWNYRCTFNGTGINNCNARLTTTLTGAWGGIPPGAKNWSTPTPSQSIDAFSQSLSPDHTLLTNHIFAGNHVWNYTCSFNGNTSLGCQTAGDETLEQYWKDQNITFQQKWPYPIQDHDQYTGVSDWGFDGTIQNDSYAVMAVISPNTLLTNYQQLQAEELRRGYDSHPIFPPSFTNGQWSWNVYQGDTFPVTQPKYLTDGSGDQGTLIQRIGTHHWVNMLEGYNGSFAYLLMTNAQFMRPFFSAANQTLSPTPTYLPGDINKDHVVNIQDYILLSNAFGTNNAAADINSDGTVNIQDYIILSNNFGKSN